MSKFVGVGFTLKASTSGSTTFGITVGQVRSISGPGISADVVDTSDLTITDNAKTKETALVDGGDFSFNVSYDPALSTHAELYNLCYARQQTGLQVIFPTTTVTWEVQGYISGISPEIPLGDLVTCDFTLAVTGKPTLPSST